MTDGPYRCALLCCCRWDSNQITNVGAIKCRVCNVTFQMEINRIHTHRHTDSQPTSAGRLTLYAAACLLTESYPCCVCHCLLRPTGRLA